MVHYQKFKYKILIGIFVIFIIGTSGYFVQSRNNKESQTNIWKTYTNHTYHYSISYPSNWKIDASKAENKPKTHDGTQMTLTSPQGNILTLRYDVSSGPPPFPIYTLKPFKIAGESFMKTYNEGCGFSTDRRLNGIEIPDPDFYDCINNVYTDNSIYQISYGLKQNISQDRVISSYTNIHGKIASLIFQFKDPVLLGDETSPNFQRVDNELDKIVTSISFSK